MRTANEITSEYADLKAQKEELNDQLKDVNSEMERVKGEFLAWCDEQGAEEMRGNGVLMTLKQKPTIRWTDHDAFIKWCAANGYTSFVYKRAAAKAIHDFCISGGTVPDGVELDSFKDVGITKSSK